MLYVVTGGSGSGKSRSAEQKLCEMCPQAGGTRIYLATMIPYGQETLKKIGRHREQRKDKGFLTLECYRDLQQFVQQQIRGRFDRPFVLLECISNLAANEMFAMEGVQAENVAEKILDGIRELKKTVCGSVIVTNEVCSDSIPYPEEMQNYRRVLSRINRTLAEEADEMSEIVCGLTAAVFSKGAEMRKEGRKGERKAEKKEGIHLVVGGAFQGKTDWAKQQYPQIRWMDGASCELEDDRPVEGMFHLEAYIRRWMKEKRGPAMQRIQQLAGKSRYAVFVCDETGCGLVPVEAFERAYREEVGRICTMLAEKAVRVDRVVCGIPVTIKDKEEKEGKEGCPPQGGDSHRISKGEEQDED